jgi:hypothetical protein
LRPASTLDRLSVGSIPCAHERGCCHHCCHATFGALEPTPRYASRAPASPSPTKGSAARLTSHADVAQLVEHHLAKVRVAGSSPVVRSKLLVKAIPGWRCRRRASPRKGDAPVCKHRMLHTTGTGRRHSSLQARQHHRHEHRDRAGTADTALGTTPTSAPANPSTNTPRTNRNRGIPAPRLAVLTSSCCQCRHRRHGVTDTAPGAAPTGMSVGSLVLVFTSMVETVSLP